MAWDYESTKAGYEAMWSSAEILESAHYDLDMIADVIIKHEEQYRWVEDDTGVPWFWIGAIHSRESSCDFTTHLHNGDPLTARTTHVPAGRPTEGDPPFTWEESAIDALEYQDLLGIEPWDCAQKLLQSELFNGTGYISPRNQQSHTFGPELPTSSPANTLPTACGTPMPGTHRWAARPSGRSCVRGGPISPKHSRSTRPRRSPRYRPRKSSQNYRLIKIRLLHTIEERRLHTGRAREIPRGVKAAILRNRR